MKYTMKITASLMAAAMSVSILGSASAGAVDFTLVGGNTSNSTTTTTTTTTTVTSSSVVQDAVSEFYRGYVKFSWTAVPKAAMYALKICDPEGNVVKTYYVQSQYTAYLVPASIFGVPHNSEKEFYACVIALQSGEADNAKTTFYAPSASKFIVKDDMSQYPRFGAPKNVAFMVKDGKLLIGWQNSNDFTGEKDFFTVSVEDQSGKTVFTKDVSTCFAEAKGLKDGQKYTVKINNRSFSAITSVDYTFVSDLENKQAGDSRTESAPKKDSDHALAAPNSISAKAGDSKITLSWSSVEDADGYRIYIYDASAKKYKTYKTVKGTKCTIKNLSNGKSYKFKVAAVKYNSATKKYDAGKASGAPSATPKSASKSK